MSFKQQTPLIFALFVLIVFTCASCSNEIDQNMSNFIRIPLERRKKIQFSSGIRRVLTDASTTVLKNSNNFAYYGNIIVGNNSQTFSVMFDTGSNALWLPNVTCSNCSPNFSHRLTCIKSINCSLETHFDTITYGDAEVSGRISKIHVGFNDENKVKQHFLLVNRTINLSDFPADGLFGLNYLNRYNYGYQNSSFVQQMYQAGYIPKSLFSFYLSFETSDSELIFGGYNPSKMKNSSEITYHNIRTLGNVNNSTWRIPGHQINMSGFSVNLDSDFVLIDSGTPNIMLSISYYNTVTSYLKKDYQVKSVSDNLEFACSQSLPDFTISMYQENGRLQSYTLPQSFYTSKINDDRCQVLFESFDGENVQIILGEVFMRRYVSIFNFADSTIGFAESIAVPPINSSSSFPKWAIYMIAIGGTVLIVVGIITYIKCKKIKNVNSLETNLVGTSQNKIGKASNNSNENSSHSSEYSSNNYIQEHSVQQQQPYYSQQEHIQKQDMTQNMFNNTQDNKINN